MVADRRRRHRLILAISIAVIGCGLVEGCSCRQHHPYFGHRTWQATYPDDWDAFKADMKLDLIELPFEATVTNLQRGRGIGVSIHIWFTLPDTKSPPEWMLHIAEQSGASDRKVRYLDRGARAFVPVDDPDDAPGDDPKAHEWAIGFWTKDPLNGGSLRYEDGVYSYAWTND